MAGKGLDRIQYQNNRPGGFVQAVKVAGNSVVAAVAGEAHGFSVLPLGTRGPFEGRQEVPGRLTSCLSSLSQARVRGEGWSGAA